MSSSSRPGKALPFDFFRESLGNSISYNKNSKNKFSNQQNNFRPDLVNLFGTNTPVQDVQETQTFRTVPIVLGLKNISFEPKIAYSKIEKDSKKKRENEVEYQLDILLAKVLEKNPGHRKHLDKLNDILKKSREIINQNKNLEEEIDPVEDFLKQRYRDRA